MMTLGPNVRLAILWAVIAILVLFLWHFGEVTLFEITFGVALAVGLFVLVLPTVLKHRKATK